MRSSLCRLEEVTIKRAQMIRGFMAGCCEGKRLAGNRRTEGKEGQAFEPQKSKLKVPAGNRTEER